MKTAGKGCLVIIVIIVVLSVIGAAAGNKKSSSTTSQSKTTNNTTQIQASLAPTAIIYEKVTAAEIVADYDKNKLAADDKYKNKPVEFVAKVKNISTDITGNPYLSLEPANADKYYFGTTLKCTFSTAEELKSLENGKNYTMHGVISEMSLGIVSVNNCSILH